MKPIKFKQANRELLGPKLMTDDECRNLWVFTDDTECVSCWKLSFKERIRALIYGKVWLGVLSGNTQPPVWLDCNDTVFEEEE